MALDGMPSLGWDNGERYSSAAEIQTFVEWVGANTEFDLHLLGRTLRNRPITALSIGSGPASRTLMINCGIHGTERPSRECGVLQLREWVRKLDARDPEFLGWLQRNRLVIIPNSNPSCAGSIRLEFP